MYIVNVAEVEDLDNKVAQYLFEIVSLLKAAQRRILSEDNIDEYDIEAAHCEDRVVAES